MPTSARLQQIEEQLRADPDDEFLRYARAMEYVSLGGDAAAVGHLRDLIALKADAPYLPAFLMCGQALMRLDKEKEAAEVLRARLRMGVKTYVAKIDGRVVGTWRRVTGKNAIAFRTTLRRALDAREQAALDAAVRRYERFMGVPVDLARDAVGR